MIQEINTLKKWFETGDFPTQNQFWDWMDSYIHKNDKISLDQLTIELQNIIGSIPPKPVIDAILEAINLPDVNYVTVVDDIYNQ